MTLDPTELNVDVQEQPRWRRTLDIRVAAAAVERERQRALDRIGKSLKVPGFRKGRAPTSLLDRHSQAVLHDTLRRIVDDAYRIALEQHGLEPISEAEVQGVDYRSGEGLSFRASFDVRPVIELSRLAGFEVEASRYSVTDADVEAAIAELLAENAIWRPAENDDAPRDGDLVTLAIEPLTDAGRPESPASGAVTPRAQSRPLEDVGLPWVRRLRLRPDTRLGRRFQLVLGEGDALPELEDAVRSLAPGETADFTISGGSPDAPSSTLRLRITLQDRRMRELPELDDAFARSLGGFRSVAELRRQVRADLEQEASEAADEQLRSTLLDRVTEANPFDVPVSLVERFIDARLGDTSQADPEALASARAQLRPEAEASVKRMLVVDRIAELHALTASPDEVDRRIAEIAESGQLPLEQVRHRLAQTGRLEALVREVTQRKVLAFLADRSTVRERG